jgi:hypothetical protein
MSSLSIPALLSLYFVYDFSDWFAGHRQTLWDRCSSARFLKSEYLQYQHSRMGMRLASPADFQCGQVPSSVTMGSVLSGSSLAEAISPLVFNRYTYFFISEATIRDYSF